MVILKHTGLSVMAMALLTLSIPTASESATDRGARRLDREIQICVAEIGKRADYGEAARVVHTVEAEQKNIAEQQFRINTLVYQGTDETAVREYNSLCVTRGPIELVRFRIDGAGQDPAH